MPNDTRHNLARIPLRWMVRQCFLTETGIMFHSELLSKIGIDPDALYPVTKARPEAVYAPVFRSLSDPADEKAEGKKEPGKESTGAKSKDKTMRMATLKFSSFKLSLPPSWTANQSGSPAKLRKRARSEPGPTVTTSGSGSGSGLAAVSDSVSSVAKSPPSPSKILTEEEEDLADALSPIYDQLKLKKAWWALEFVPMRHRVQKEDDSWGTEVA